MVHKVAGAFARMMTPVITHAAGCDALRRTRIISQIARIDGRSEARRAIRSRKWGYARAEITSQ